MSEENAQKVVVDVHIDQTDLDEVMQKTERIRDLVKEARLLAGELSSKEINLKLRVES